MAPGGTLFRFAPHFGENVLPHGSHEWLPYSKDEVRLKSVNNNLSHDVCMVPGRVYRELCPNNWTDGRNGNGLRKISPAGVPALG